MWLSAAANVTMTVQRIKLTRVTFSTAGRGKLTSDPMKRLPAYTPQMPAKLGSLQGSEISLRNQVNMPFPRDCGPKNKQSGQQPTIALHTWHRRQEHHTRNSDKGASETKPYYTISQKTAGTK
ncbi:unnamed protein product [Ectocarpus sp. 8 AP-2014]